MVNEIIIYVGSFGFVGLLLYVVLRFGPVDNQWCRLTKDETKELENLNKEYKRNYPSPEVKPAGVPIYKKNLVSHTGMLIYTNGIYAKFSLGTKGKYRFVPFENISGIFPGEADNPYAAKDSVLTGPASMKVLQIETKDYMTLVVFSNSHKFEVLVPKLKEAIGPKWNELYKILGKFYPKYIEVVERIKLGVGLPKILKMFPKKDVDIYL